MSKHKLKKIKKISYSASYTDALDAVCGIQI